MPTSTPRSRSRSTSTLLSTVHSGRSGLSSVDTTSIRDSDDPVRSGITGLSATVHANGHVALGASTPSPTSSSRPKLSSSLSYTSATISPSKHAHGSTASVGRSTNSPIPGAKAHGARVRSRTSTISYTPPLAPVMSRENSLDEPDKHLHLGSSLPSSQTLQVPPPAGGIRTGRKASKSVSNARPSAGTSITPQRTSSYDSPSLSAEPATAPIPSLLYSPTDGNNPRKGLKRRISTPSLAAQREEEEAQAGPSEMVKQSDTRTRARSTSTSLVIPEPQPKYLPVNAVAGPSNSQPASSSSKSKPTQSSWTPTAIHPPVPTDASSSSRSFGYNDLPSPHPRSNQRDVGLLTSAYNLGESSILRLSRWMLPSKNHRPSTRRGSDGDSEKGLDPNDEDMTVDSATSNAASRTSEDSIRRNGRYWGMWQHGSEEEEEGGYFSLPPTPPDEKPPASLADFEAALNRSEGIGASLPTPALSTRSLSRHGSKRRSRIAVDREGEVAQGWLTTVLNIWTNLGNRRRPGGKTAEVLRDLGWTVALLIGLFLVTAGTALWMIQALPITQLKHLPTSTTDLQLLSAEIRSYMASSDVGYWHTVGVLTFVGCWKHAWSVPGAVVLNILVGSVLEPMPALLLLTLITATGSLFSYLLCRPLAPLISVLFPKPLALVRAALAPDQVPHPPASDTYEMDEKVTAVHVSPNPAAPAIGGESNGSVWRRLLIMRAMGFVPWSGMNVACGVVNVDWKIFWLTTAAGSASWSYVTASVGNILSRLAIPPAALEGGANGEMIDGESLTSLLRDPVLIAKLVFLSGLTLLPVVLKRRRNSAPTADVGIPLNRDVINTRLGGVSSAPFSPTSPSSPLTQSLARFTPTPAAFDLLSFGRTALRQGGRVVAGTAQSAAGGVRRVLGSWVG